MNTYAHRPLRFMESSGNIHWLLFSLIIYSIYQCLNSILEIIGIFFKESFIVLLKIKPATRQWCSQVTWSKVDMFHLRSVLSSHQLVFASSFISQANMLCRSHLRFLQSILFPTPRLSPLQ